jgi:TonB family protein
MFFRHFGLDTQPFGVTPDPSFLYESGPHREALASLINSIESGLGFSSLIGDPGLGKTTLLYALLERYGPTSRTAFVFTARSRGDELLRQILDDFEVPVPKDEVNAMYRSFRDMLVAEASSGRRVILFLDEAQALSASALNAVRLLSNFETRSSKLLHIIIAGQSELADVLKQPKLAALRQRINKPTRLRPLSFGETRQYIEHRLQVAGAGYSDIFTPGALALIAEKSEGIPRAINRLCMNAMTVAYGSDSTQVNEAHVREALEDLEVGVVRPPKPEIGPVLVTQLAAPVVSKPEVPANFTWGSQALAIVPSVVADPKPVVANPKPVVTDPKPVATPTAVVETKVAAEPPPLSPVAFEILDPVLALRSDVRREPWIPIPIVKQQNNYLVIGALLGILFSAVGIGLLTLISHHTAAVDAAFAPPRPVLEALPLPPSQEQLLNAAIRAGHRRGRVRRTMSSSLAITPASMRRNAATIPTVFDPARSAVPAPRTKELSYLGNLGSQTSPITIKAAPVERSGNLPRTTPAVLLHRVEPTYPADAKAQNVRGAVKMRLHLDKAGHVSSVIVLSGDRRLAESAQDAVRQWLFSPFQQDGVPLAGDTTVSLQFPPTQ